MDAQQKIAWLKLANTPKINHANKRVLIDHFGSAEKLYDTPFSLVQKTINADSTFMQHLAFDVPDVQLQQQLQLLEQHQIQIIPWGHEHYPALLAQLSDAPVMLFCQGDVSLLNGPQIAMVGSRSASPGGLKTAFEFAKQLAQAGISITSGLAQGIDGAAHKGALPEVGKTIAVVATGLDQVYPRNHNQLANQIRQQGVIVSEFVPTTGPRREYFPQRNRLISGLALGVLVVEAGIRSGSLITARLAGEQGREIYAIPGSIHLPTSRGCHQLIRQGAKLVETTKDILEELRNSVDLFAMLPQDDTNNDTHATNNLNADSKKILDLIDFAPTGLDELAEQTHIPIDKLSSILLELELSGLVAATSGGRYQRLK